MPAAGAQVGFCTDPDADRLALVDERGHYLGEEYTLALCVDHVLRHRPGPIVTNCSTSRMSQDLAAKYGVPFYRSAVGEANVVDAMIERDAALGGEGNGGVIDPRVVMVRDSVVAMALVLDAMATRQLPLSRLAEELPRYEIVKAKVVLPAARIAGALASLDRAFCRREVRSAGRRPLRLAGALAAGSGQQHRAGRAGSGRGADGRRSPRTLQPSGHGPVGRLRFFFMPDPGVQLLYEDGPCLVVLKPAGLLTQAPPGIDSLEVRVKTFLKEREGKTGNIYLTPVHRLDRPVSGAMLLARNVRAAQRLSKQFQRREVRKTYWALVEGIVDPAEGTWRDTLWKIHGQPRSQVVPADHPGGQPAVLHYRTLGQCRLRIVARDRAGNRPDPSSPHPSRLARTCRGGRRPLRLRRLPSGRSAQSRAIGPSPCTADGLAFSIR